ncbi:hypothetical protein E3A20_11180 [Planctomyces bekefii]|uniref:Uncharacterized protein n=1 Tax=Planctomyces bekefii TaxID=1653850 RepID=A0A5C6M9Y8_9PLAN|nr:hypothetical protein E3A20_11180 [Planctomyces bekefii]
MDVLSAELLRGVELAVRRISKVVLERRQVFRSQKARKPITVNRPARTGQELIPEVSVNGSSISGMPVFASTQV